jgi:hypothetical protein
MPKMRDENNVWLNVKANLSAIEHRKNEFKRNENKEGSGFYEPKNRRRLNKKRKHWMQKCVF